MDSFTSPEIASLAKANPALAVLDDIALGEAEPGPAQQAIASLLSQGTTEGARRVYTALGAWAWKAIDGRRRDDELRSWHQVIGRARAGMMAIEPCLADRLLVLQELLHESIQVAAAMPAEEIAERLHVRAALTALRGSPDGRMRRKELMDRLGLKQGNVTRILVMMATAGLVERTARGAEAEFALTRRGQQLAPAAHMTVNCAGRKQSRTPSERFRTRRAHQDGGRVKPSFPRATKLKQRSALKGSIYGSATA